MTHLNPAAPKWKQWRADYYGTTTVLNPHSKRSVHKVKAHAEPDSVSTQPKKSSLFGKLFGRD